MTKVRQDRLQTYWTYVDGPNAVDAPHYAERKILIDLWLELGEAGKVSNSMLAIGPYLSRIERRDVSPLTASRRTLEIAIKALTRKALPLRAKARRAAR